MSDASNMTRDELYQEVLRLRASLASPPAVAAGGVTEAVEQLVVREARRVEILNWLQEEIGTGWTCDNCGYCTYHSNANECADCGAPFPLEHLLAFKLHATATEDAELIAESRATFEASGILTAAIAVRDEGVREGWRHDHPFITSTSARPEYYVTVKVRDIKALHDAHDIVLRAFSEAVRLGGSNADQN